MLGFVGENEYLVLVCKCTHLATQLVTYFDFLVWDPIHIQLKMFGGIILKRKQVLD